MRFDKRRLDGDPTYSPGLSYDRDTPYWRPSQKDIKNGYEIRSYRLSGLSLAQQAAKCRELTRDLLRWRDGCMKAEPGTWGWAIARYRIDEFSPYHEVKPNTRKSYDEVLSRLEASIGKVKIASTTFEVLKRLQRGMATNYLSRAIEIKKRRMDQWRESAEKTRKFYLDGFFGPTLPLPPVPRVSEDPTAYVHRMFTHLRIVANYGLAIQPALFRDVCSILGSGALKVRAPKPRDVATTQEQILSVIAKADEAGDHGFALGLSLQWWLTLRAVDVRGQWFETRQGEVWADGLTWDMVDLESRTISKMVSKTERYDAREMVWDLTPLPDLVARLEAIPADERIGAVVKHDGKPFAVRAYREKWRKYARAAGVPDHVQLMDTRAGAINDAMLRGADKLALQHAANHRSSDTTERYIRARDVGANNVIKLRAGTTKQHF